MRSAVSGRLVAGRYRLGSVIGHGGMGAVWQARDQLLNRDVAVKELVWPPDFTEHERQVACRRATREAQTAAKLSHPNIVRIYDIVEEDGDPWIIMELLPFRSLRDILRDDGPLPPAQAARVGLGVLAALRAAHTAGIVHRDVKPANILVGPDDRAVLTDFGIARAADSATLTNAGDLIGSPSYIAPERARGERAGAQADLWGLGASLYAAVEGRPPFHRGNALATLTAVVADEPDPASHAGPLWPLISALLRKDPDARPGEAEIERMLRGVAGGETTRVIGNLTRVIGNLWPPASAHAEGRRPAGISAAQAAGAGTEEQAGAEAGQLAEPEAGAAAVPQAGAAAVPEADAAAVPEADAGAVPEAGAAAVPEAAAAAEAAAGTAAMPAAGTAAMPAAESTARSGAGQAAEAETEQAAGPETGQAAGEEAGPSAAEALIPGLAAAADETRTPDREPPGPAVPPGPVAPPGPRTGRNSPRRRRRSPRRIAAPAGLAVLAAAACAVALLLTNSGSPSRPAAGTSPAGHPVGAAPSTTPGGSSHGAPSPSTSPGGSSHGAPSASTSPGGAASPSGGTAPSGGTGPTGASQPPASSSGQPASGSGGNTGYGALPAGFYRFTNSTGFSIGVPSGWQISHQGHYVYVTDPADGGIFLLIDQSDQPKPDPLADWQEQAAARSGSYPGYHLIRLQSVYYPQAEKAADWEFTYDRSGVLVHILNRNILANATHAYALYWSVPQAQWDAYYHYFQAFAGTFRPAA